MRAEPAPGASDPTALLLAYLDYYRATVVAKVDGLDDAQLRARLVPSGWSVLELVKHLAFMERRWVEWGFAGRPVPDPWGDQDDEGRWRVGAGEGPAAVVERLDQVGRRTRLLVGRAPLAQAARLGGRFVGDEPPPDLGWILVHVLQEYARHVGHLDVVRELTDGAVGE
jgi:hypothetical protein